MSKIFPIIVGLLAFLMIVSGCEKILSENGSNLNVRVVVVTDGESVQSGRSVSDLETSVKHGDHDGDNHHGGHHDGHHGPWVTDMDSLVVEISEFSYKYCDGEVCEWATPTDVDVEIDLIALDNEGEEFLWLSFDVPEGAELKVIRFVITQATITIDGTEYPVYISSGDMVINININTALRSDGEIVLSIDPYRIVKRYKGSGGYEYQLVPRFAHRCRESNEEFMKIFGTITINGSEPSTTLFLELYDASDTLVAGKFLPVCKEGEFYLGRRPEGDYTLFIYDGLEFDDEGDITGKELLAEHAFHHPEDGEYTELDIDIETEE